MKTVEVSCTEIVYGEFPDLLFGTTEGNQKYFDATNFISKKGDLKKHKVSIFEIGILNWKNAIQKAYELSSEDIIVTDKSTGHILIDEALALLFVAYIDEQFAVHLLERMEEVFKNGFSFSDSALSVMIQNRFPNSTITDA